MNKMSKMSKKLWLSKCVVWFVLFLAAPVISQAENYTYDTAGRLTGVTYNSGEAQPRHAGIAEQGYTMLYGKFQSK